MSYVDDMQRICGEGFERLFAQVDTESGISFVDFPDYPNVGDSAIALGGLRFFEKSNIDVVSAMCIGTLRFDSLRERKAVYINGGGNIAGFFEGIDVHRNSIAQLLPESVTLIQGPQSIHWANADAEEEFTARFLRRPQLRIAVRDSASFEKLVDKGAAPLLMPDAVHMLGTIKAPPPSRDYVVLARGDRESANTPGTSTYPDWLKDYRRTSVESRFRWKYRYLGKLGGHLNPDPAGWRSIAESRLTRGVRMLASGETVITDRLHAMLIALQMGRQVIAVDNSNHKLSNYANTWFRDVGADVQFVDNIGDAIEMAR